MRKKPRIGAPSRPQTPFHIIHNARPSVVASSTTPLVTRSSTWQTRDDAPTDLGPPEFACLPSPTRSPAAPRVPPPAEPLPPPPPTARLPTFQRLPRSLELLGNAKAWGYVLQHMRTHPHMPLVVWGPTGCGKSMGCRLLLEECGYRVLTLDGADGEDNRELIRWIRQSRGTKVNTDGRHTAVVLDDFESFTEKTRKEITSYLLKTKDNPRMGAIFVTLTQFRAPMFKEMSGVSSVKLFAPFEHVLRTWFELHHPWTIPLDGGGEQARLGFGHGRVLKVKDAIATRDIRRVDIQIKWVRDHQSKPPTARGATPVFVNIFDATRRLFSPDGDWIWWAQNAEARDVHLLQEHYTTYQIMPDGPLGATTMDTTADTLDTLSLSNSLEPRSYELHHAQQTFNLAMASLAVSSTTRSPSVGALAPPAPPRPRLDRREQRYADDMPQTLLEHLKTSAIGAPPPDRASRDD